LQYVTRRRFRGLLWLSALALVGLGIALGSWWVGWSAAVPLLVLVILYALDPTTKDDRFQDRTPGPHVPPGAG
jgi:hypothetical protein